MSTTRTEPTPMMLARHMTDAGGGGADPAMAVAVDRPFVSVVVPAYNEAAVVQTNLAVLCGYLRTLEQKYDWEVVVVNDGSKDETSRLARAFAATVRAASSSTTTSSTSGLGQALKFAFGQCRGEVIVTIDMDLSYSPDHIERLVDALRKTKARIVVASCYMPGGKVENVPTFRRWLSVGANRFLSVGSHGRLKTLTGMVRATTPGSCGRSTSTRWAWRSTARSSTRRWSSGPASSRSRRRSGGTCRRSGRPSRPPRRRRLASRA